MYADIRCHTNVENNVQHGVSQHLCPNRLYALFLPALLSLVGSSHTLTYSLHMTFSTSQVNYCQHAFHLCTPLVFYWKVQAQNNSEAFLYFLLQTQKTQEARNESKQFMSNKPQRVLGAA